MKAAVGQMRLAQSILVALALLSVAVLLYFFPPGQHSFYPRCGFHALTGLDCPGCGSLRATHQLLHGHFKEAFALNPLFVSLLPACGFLVCQPARIRELDRQRWWRWSFPLAIILFAIFRNLPPSL